MVVFLYLEASQSQGVSFRLGLGCIIHPYVASAIAKLLRLT